ncbi:DUF2752 domain-containing protein [Streptomyces sp. NPDC006733]|uniref:DUF2752 domain-containing protein n=1 Tax=Streptomyces sp. NPDC006733 TaxID=3155460 RepID=UPI0033D6662E
MAETRPRPTAGRVRRLVTHPASVPLALLAGAGYLWTTNPHEPGHLLPRCPFNWATGLLCPGCGATRMLYDLMHGDLPGAFHDNAALFLIVPMGLYLYGRWLVEGLRGRAYRPVIPNRYQAVLIGGALLWGVLRNIN